MIRRLFTYATAIGLCMLLTLSFASSNDGSRSETPEKIVPLDGVKVLKKEADISRVVTGQSDVVRVQVVNSREILVFGLKQGATTLHVWTNDTISQYILTVQEVSTSDINKRFRQLIGDDKKTADGQYGMRVFSPEYQSISKFEQHIKELLGPEGQIVLEDDSSGKIFVIGKPSVLDKIKQLIDQLDVPSDDAMFTERIELQNRAVTEVQDKITEMLTGEGSSVIDEETNSILIVDTVDSVKRISSYLRKIDVRTVRQVRVTARFVELEENVSRQLGINFQNVGSLDGQTVNTTQGQDVVANIGSGAGADGLVVDLLRGNDEVGATLEALEDEGKAKLISSPNVVTRNQQEAVLEIVNETTFTESCNVTLDDEGNVSQVTPSVETITDGITLSVTPLISKNNDVVQLDVVPELSDFTLGQGNTTQGCTFFTPSLNRRTAQLNVALEDGQTLVIGGLKRSDINRNETKVPLLGDIPVFGQAFKQSTTTDNSRNITIFLTADILRVGSQSDTGSKQTKPKKQLKLNSSRSQRPVTNSYSNTRTSTR